MYSHTFTLYWLRKTSMIVVSLKLPCVYECLSSRDLFIFLVRVSSFFSYNCVIHTSVLSFPFGLYIEVSDVLCYKPIPLSYCQVWASYVNDCLFGGYVLLYVVLIKGNMVRFFEDFLLSGPICMDKLPCFSLRCFSINTNKKLIFIYYFHLTVPQLSVSAPKYT